MKIIGYAVGSVIANSEGEVCKNQSCLEFLLQPKPETIRMMYSLDFDVGNLLTMLHLNEEERRALARNTKINVQPCYHLRYVPNKLFSVKRPRGFAYYADASQYIKYPNEDLAMSPIELAQRAKEIGEQVYKVLGELGMSPTSLVNPARAYEKTQLKWLYEKRLEAKHDPVKIKIIDGIGAEIYGTAWSEYIARER